MRHPEVNSQAKGVFVVCSKSVDVSNTRCQPPEFDSGSLLVEDVATNLRAIGLLYAGSSTNAIANPINQVLRFLGATMVGQ